MATSINYPDILPGVLVANCTYKTQETFLRTNVEMGAARQRRRFTTSPTMFTISFLFEQGAASYFESWYFNTLVDGQEWFNIDLPVGAGFVSHVARFIANPTMTPQNPTGTAGSIFGVTAQIEVEEKQLDTLLTQGQISFISAMGGFQEAQDVFDILDNMVNVTYKSAEAGV